MNFIHLTYPAGVKFVMSAFLLRVSALLWVSVGSEPAFSEILKIGASFFIGFILFAIFLFLAIFTYIQLPEIIDYFIDTLASERIQKIYAQVIVPYREKLRFVVVFLFVDTLLLLLPGPNWLDYCEILIGLLAAFNVILLGFQFSEKLFENYLLGVALEDRRKTNSELLVLGNFLSKASIILIVIFVFAQTHQINLIGLVASLGVAGAAIAFGSQKVIEQILWSVVLYIDRPFAVDDYIYLPDRTLGRVESIGWRSTKIRLSGKNTLSIVPNSSLAQVSIENLTRAKRVISMLNLTFLRAMSDEEKSLIHQLILRSTSDISGIDHRLTQVSLQETIDEQGQESVQARVIFFILGTTDVSMELRKGLLEIARENTIGRLRECGIRCSFEEKILEISQPMNV